ncbi:MAG: hypothetical protein K8W52_14885 [Deltaproteobacteria bacterium]|nr:hypothetical protein [Deltaproteobacteria bacterium]
MLPRLASHARPPGDAAPGCTPWLTDVDNQRPAGATLGATVHDGLLELSSTGDGQGTCGSAIEPCTAVKVYTSAGLVGDFDAVLEVESVEGGTTFGGVDFFVTNGFAANTELIIAGTEHGANLQWRHGNTSWSAAASTTRATLRLHRVGTTLTATGTAGTVVLEQSAFASGDLQLGIGLREGTSAAITGRITDLTVDGGGGAVASDGFDCTANLLP